ncbi:hypothetical protein E6H13_09880 [Candidatus Bathyarchaeota archaeon]|nr:MAG: hypothetical protein E6H13_09880 [Candidatus Bathyarchaeota archaeon]
MLIHLSQAIEPSAFNSLSLSSLPRQGASLSSETKWIPIVFQSLVLSKIPSRGRGRLAATMLGSVSEKAAHKCNCSVLIVKRPLHR